MKKSKEEPSVRRTRLPFKKKSNASASESAEAGRGSSVTGSDAGYEKRRSFRRRKIAVLLIVLILLISSFSIGTSVWLYTLREREECISQAYGAAKIAASVIDIDKVDDYIKNGEEEPGYFETTLMLYGIRDNTVDVKYLYALKPTEDGCLFIFDLPFNDDDPYRAGEVIPYDEYFLPLRSDLMEGKEIAPIETNDKFGWLITVYHPVYDRFGNFVYYVGVDVSMESVRKSIMSFLYLSMMITLVFLLMVSLVLVWVSHHYRKESDSEEMLHKQERENNIMQEIVMAFVQTVDMKDKYTNGHSFRVAKYTAMICEELGYDEDTIEAYYNIALLHDIGKIAIPDEVLNKPVKLTNEEFELIKSHTTLGYNVLKGISIRPEVAQGAHSHHERPDGKGYPQGLKGDEIPRIAQIIAVADTFDAMYSSRPYRDRMNYEKAVQIIKDGSGTQLASDVVDAFLRIAENDRLRAPNDKGGGTTEDIDNIRDTPSS